MARVIKELKGNLTTVYPNAHPIIGRSITAPGTQDDLLEHAGMGKGPAAGKAVIPAAGEDNVRRAKDWVDHGSLL